MKKTNDITKIVRSSLLTRLDAEKALAYLVEHDIKEIDMKKVEGGHFCFY